jgi:hypothetical protein
MAPQHLNWIQRDGVLTHTDTAEAVTQLSKSGVAVEKLDLPENQPKRSDQKCIGDRRKSFIGHPDATHFRRKFGERVFQQPQAITPTTPMGPADFSTIMGSVRLWNGDT